MIDRRGGKRTVRVRVVFGGRQFSDESCCLNTTPLSEFSLTGFANWQYNGTYKVDERRYLNGQPTYWRTRQYGGDQYFIYQDHGRAMLNFGSQYKKCGTFRDTQPLATLQPPSTNSGGQRMNFLWRGDAAWWQPQSEWREAFGGRTGGSKEYVLSAVVVKPIGIVAVEDVETLVNSGHVKLQNRMAEQTGGARRAREEDSLQEMSRYAWELGDGGAGNGDGDWEIGVDHVWEGHYEGGRYVLVWKGIFLVWKGMFFMR